MQTGIPSRTAFRVALRRAAHQQVDRPVVFRDPLAIRILGKAAAEGLRAPQRLSSRGLRAFLVARSRYAEDCVARAFADGVRQYVLLGAGLDTFAYRNPHMGLRVFEVDHAATQLWKFEMLRDAGIDVPRSVGHVAVDFERDELEVRLHAMGWCAQEPTVFGWLGVVPYLEREGFSRTLEVIAKCPSGSGFVMDYGLPRDSLPLAERLALDSLSARVAAAGEPFRLFFAPEEMNNLLTHKGFQQIEDLDGAAINTRYFAEREDGLRVLGTAGHLLSAWL